jgi:hypothetical protein
MQYMDWSAGPRHGNKKGADGALISLQRRAFI